ncbi:MAG: RNA-binding transcriptional accessory protein [bacterium]|nr:RNA-binding transcriptional accessory protein [bacterium]
MEEQLAGGLEPQFVSSIAQEIACTIQQVAAAAELLAGGATVPFVARYRKEATGGLDDAALETLAKQREYFVDLTERRDVILAAIKDQGQLTPDLDRRIRSVTTKSELEDLYLPYRPKRRTRASMARERGLEPLAEALLKAARGQTSPAELAAEFVNDELDAESALSGARDILAERLAEDAQARARLRRTYRNNATFEVQVVAGKEAEGATYSNYFDHQEPASRVPSHRMLAILRGERDGFLASNLRIDDENEMSRLAEIPGVPLTTPAGKHVALSVSDSYKRLLRPSIGNEIRTEMKERAESEAIRVFRANLGELLMQPPFGQQSVIGLDPGLRTGCKLAVVDPTGKVTATDVLYAVPDGSRTEAAKKTLIALCRQHKVQAIAVGNGTASRETEAFARKSLRDAGLDGVMVVIVPETGASIYSASEVARRELPDLDVSLRGAASIARRMQDPLAELVKIEPKSLGVGQYQHDVNQKSLAEELDREVESAVNRVGVELNSASISLLERVSGISAKVAGAIVRHREEQGRFNDRRRLLKVPGLGPKAFQLCAGFLRIHDARNPLDQTAVHPERYSLVKKMAKSLGLELELLIGEAARRIDLQSFVDLDNGIGRPTLVDIQNELERPGRDIRPEFEAPTWRDDVTSIEDLKPGLILEGRVSNVTNFGAFVDLGVKRDGLVHISQLSDSWIDDPRSVLHVGQVVKVAVLDVDQTRGRISLSMKAEALSPG